jgi:hypothetical protein
VIDSFSKFCVVTIESIQKQEKKIEMKEICIPFPKQGKEIHLWHIEELQK